MELGYSAQAHLFKAPMKKHTSIGLNTHIRRLIRKMSKHYGMTQAAVISMCVREKANNLWGPPRNRLTRV